MKVIYLILLLSGTLLFACHNASNPATKHADTSATVKAETKLEIPLLKEIKQQQDYITRHRIASAFVYSKPLHSSAKDTLSQIQRYDTNGRLVSIRAVSQDQTYTFWERTFSYSANGVLQRRTMKLSNGQSVDEFFFYTTDGHLSSSVGMTPQTPFIDTSKYVYTGDTLLTYRQQEGELMPRPNITIFNKKGLEIKSIDNMRSFTTPFEISLKKYSDSCPIPQKEIKKRIELTYQLKYY